MARKSFAWFLVLHGLAHSGPGMWLAEGRQGWPFSLVWLAATLGFLGAGLGLLGARWLRPRTRLLAAVGVLGSAILLVSLPHPLALLGLLADVLIVLALWQWPGWRWQDDRPARGRHGRIWRALGDGAALGLMGYLAVLILLRPWHSSWGATPEDLTAALPGDQQVLAPGYRIDHVIRIRAPAAKVWPWLLQLGQDRGGFYSYAWLENLVGARIRNVDRIVPEWQERRVGEKVRAVPPTWMGGRFGREIGWKVTELVPGRALVLEGWGAFVVDSLDPGTSRLYVRTRGEGRPALGGVFLAPIGLMVFEPAHFIMERAMLRGIRERAERL